MSLGRLDRCSLMTSWDKGIHKGSGRHVAYGSLLFPDQKVSTSKAKDLATSIMKSILDDCHLELELFADLGCFLFKSNYRKGGR